MRRTPWVLVALVALVALATSVWPDGGATARALRYFTRDEIERGRAYARPLRALGWVGRVAGVALLASLVSTGLGRRLADACGRLARGRFVPTLLLVGLALGTLNALLALPLEVAEYAHERAWGVTHRPFGAWLLEWAKGLAVGLPIGGVVLLGFYGILRRFPRRGYLVAAAGAGALAVAAAAFAPVVIAPLFNDFRPIGRTRWAALEPDLRALCARGGVAVDEVLVMDASRQDRHTNAYFAGVLGTRRIVLYDTLLDSHPRDEVLSILGHELGHWKHRHEAKGLALGGAMGLVFLAALWRLLARCVGRGPLRMHAPWDPAGLPLVLLFASAAGLVSAPLGSAASRAFEREADDEALALGGDARVFIASERRLVLDNLADPAPSALRVWLFASHPPPVERIERACAAQPAACAVADGASSPLPASP